MNHPFPTIVPLLRKIYGQRFKRVLFLIPFERSPDPDIVPVYRGSYCHAGYVTDALARLREVECEHFLFMHDDVLLNPCIDESNFFEFFRITERDGFIARSFAMQPDIGSWTWLFGFLPRLLFPKSIVLGSGVEQENLSKYLPSPELVEAKLAAAGLPTRTVFTLDGPLLGEAVEQASRTLIHGLAAALDPGLPEQQRSELQARAAMRELAAAYMAALEAQRSTGMPTHEGAPGHVEPELPIVSSGFFADFYIVPRVALEDYAHYIGVASAANLFSEMMVPTILHAVCDRVWNAEQLGLDFSQFQPGIKRDLQSFRDDRCVAIHPIKMSRIVQNEATEARFLAALWRLRDGQAGALPVLATGETASFCEWGIGEPALTSGWQPGEDWGRWMSETVAFLDFGVQDPAVVSRLTLNLLAPVGENSPVLEGEVFLNGRHVHDLKMAYPVSHQEVELEVEGRLNPEHNRLEFRSPHMVQMSEIAGSNDDRQLSFGIIWMRVEGGR